MNTNTLKLAPAIDGNGSYVNFNKQIQNSNPLIFNIYYLLRKIYGTWLYDANTGSKLFTLVNTRGTNNKTILSQLVQDALQPLINQNKISLQGIQVAIDNLNNSIILVDVLDAQGKSIRFTLPQYITN